MVKEMQNSGLEIVAGLTRPLTNRLSVNATTKINCMIIGTPTTYDVHGRSQCKQCIG